ncbi:hypothetical protein BCR33DRAFT_844940 [Rhizoclosmatium globosum]|uniref:DUF676 domain-containing protein n=1 Tax=Rhizoclosmatium globosum TaxID=329046 RepID=A0A1Y2D314_9FUNG|nr:hypothetical protein BCR33DRAFT_844940 [Rhizoclosmatium globosum]|eukprot:ORY53672.1 hypothetical protein BCR33DRAFT_844940 [Rhizoclosmatium globosum]
MMHLIVLIHGFQGYASDLAFLARQIGLEAERRACQDSVHCLLVECNHERTTDSIVTQSQRIVDEISAWIQRQSNNDSIQLSLVGHSLGGVKARCVAKLVASTHPSITLAHYVSVATPHLGSKYSGLVPSPAVELFAGQMGKELVLNDNPSSPLLLQMATDPSYTIPLASFRSRTAYAWSHTIHPCSSKLQQFVQTTHASLPTPQKRLANHCGACSILFPS